MISGACSSTAASQRCPAGAGDSCGPRPSWAPRLQGSGLGARSTYSSAAHGSLCGSFSIQPASGYGFAVLQRQRCSCLHVVTLSTWTSIQRSCSPQSHHHSLLPPQPKNPHHSPWRLSSCSRRCHQQSGRSSWSGCGPRPLSVCSTAGLPWLSCLTRCHTFFWWKKAYMPIDANDISNPKDR